MAMQFKKASRSNKKLRMALIGPSGSGKTYTALQIGSYLGKRIALIDSENGSASVYATVGGKPADPANGEFEFDALNLDSYSPEMYVQAINLAEREGYDVIVIDSLSHAWMGKDGALEQVENAAKRSKSGNSFTAWRDVTPMHNRLVDAIIHSTSHIIATMRTKTEWVLEKDSNGRTAPRKIGLAPVQRAGIEFEVDIVGDMDDTNTFIVSKTRCKELSGKVIRHPGKELAETIKSWLDVGHDIEPDPPQFSSAKPPEASRPKGNKLTGDDVKEQCLMFEKTLVEEGLCNEGEFMAAVKRAAEKNNFGADYEKWTSKAEEIYNTYNLARK